MLTHLDIFSEVALCPNEHKWSEGGVRSDLWNPFLRNVLEGGWANYAEAQQENVSTGVTQRTQLVKLILETGNKETTCVHEESDKLLPKAVKEFTSMIILQGELLIVCSRGSSTHTSCQSDYN